MLKSKIDCFYYSSKNHSWEKHIARKVSFRQIVPGLLEFAIRSIGTDGEVYDSSGSSASIIHRTVVRDRKAAIVGVEYSMDEWVCVFGW